MYKSGLRNVRPYLINAAVVVLVALAFPLANVFTPMGELIRWLDGFSYRWQIHSTPVPESSTVRIIDFDQLTFTETGVRPSPLDRALLKDVLEKTASSSPAVIVLDIDLRHRLRHSFEKGGWRIPIADSWLDELDIIDDHLTQAINRITLNGTPIVLGMSGENQSRAKPMAFDTRNAALYFGRTSAVVRSVDRVIYDLPTMLSPSTNISDSSAINQSAQPSLALATWAAYQGLPSNALLSGIIPANFDKKQFTLWHTLSGGAELLVNWYRLDPQGRTALMPHFPAVALTRVNFPVPELEGKIVVIGRSHFITEPITEQADRYLTPYSKVHINGVDLQALFIDNLLNNSWISKPTWWFSLSLGSLLGILLGSAFLWVGMHKEIVSSLGYWGYWLTNPLLSFAFGLIVSLAIALALNLLFIQDGMYMASLALMPLTGFIEAILYTAWASRT